MALSVNGVAASLRACERVPSPRGSRGGGCHRLKDEFTFAFLPREGPGASQCVKCTSFIFAGVTHGLMK